MCRGQERGSFPVRHSLTCGVAPCTRVSLDVSKHIFRHVATRLTRANHFYLLVWARGAALASFMQYLRANLSRKVGRLVDWSGRGRR
jgi:hypothetical protein